MHALKTAVVVMGLLIVAAFGMVVYTLIGRLSDAPASSLGTVDLPLPEGCTIAESHAEDERLILRLEGLPGRGCQQVLVFDLSSGEELGRFRAVPAP